MLSRAHMRHKVSYQISTGILRHKLFMKVFELRDLCKYQRFQKHARSTSCSVSQTKIMVSNRRGFAGTKLEVLIFFLLCDLSDE